MNIKSIKTTKDSIIINDTYEITLDGTVWWDADCLRKGDFPKGVFDLARLIKTTADIVRHKED